MQLPLCVNCVTSETYCPSCQQKLDSGAVSGTERKLCEKISIYAQRFPLSNACFTKALEVGDTVVVLSTQPAALIGRKGALVLLLTRDFKKRFKIIDPNSHPSLLIQELILPARSLGVNTIFKPGAREYKVRVPYHQKKLLPFTPADFSNVLKQLNVEASIVFE
ncbi:MAG: hypothetical protein V1834_04985 [Candidatus Micrarchaeota archaeon]